MDKFVALVESNLGSSNDMEWYWRLLIVVGVFLAAYLVDFIFVKAIIPTLRALTAKTDTEVDDILLSEKVVRSFSHIIPPIVLTIALPYVTQGTLEQIIAKLTSIYIIINVTRFLCILINALFEAILTHGRDNNKTQTRMKSMRGLVQTAQIFICAIACIMVVSTLINKSPAYLISGLGAMAAVLMLVFQDSIKGLVASIQLMFNNMVEVGDWISMPSRNIDGVVQEITLTTVKVQNWDNTILTVPPSSLLTETFQNWRGMQQGQGRRLTRNIHIDMQSVHFLTAEEADKLGVIVPQGHHKTNLELFRQQLYAYLKQHPDINDQMTLMVRQLPSVNEGIPVQIYAFTYTKVWEEYEEVQARLIEYALASLHRYNLVAFQRSGGLKPVDLR